MIRLIVQVAPEEYSIVVSRLNVSVASSRYTSARGLAWWC